MLPDIVKVCELPVGGTKKRGCDDAPPLPPGALLLLLGAALGLLLSQVNIGGGGPLKPGGRESVAVLLTKMLAKFKNRCLFNALNLSAR